MTTANNAKLNGRGYWRSLEELAQSDEFQRHVDKEFPGGIERSSEGVNRRRFLQIMAASTAMAGLAGCRWPEETIVPFARRPEGFTPGVARHFATALEHGGVGQALLATSYDGRPIKVDGNPDHPWSLGAATAQTQASVLDLWDVERSRTVVRHGQNQAVSATWDDFAAFASEQFERLAGVRGRGLAVLGEASSSPTRRRLREELQRRFPEMRWFQHDPVDDRARLEGSARAFGSPMRDVPHLEKARIVADFDADLLHRHPAALRNARMFGRRRRPERDTMSRVYAFEPTLSHTGVVADHRVPVPHSRIPAALGALAVTLVDAHGLALPAASGLTAADLATFRGGFERMAEIEALASDLVAHRGQGLITVGERQPAGAHHLAHVLNAALGNLGETVTMRPAAAPDADLAALREALLGGRVDTLVILGTNPMATAPADLPFGEALAAAPTTIHLSEHRDGTSQRCQWHLPRTHYLECWGDAQAADGSLLAVQPLIEPLFGSRSDLEVLAMMLGAAPPRGHDLVRTTFHRRTGGTGDAPRNDDRFEERWRRFLHDGFLAAEAAPAPRLRSASLDLPLDDGPSDDDLELLITADSRLHDGRYADNAWLQEMPDHATKVVWDNVASLSPNTADRLGVRHGDVVEVAWRGRQVELPAYVLPGQASNTVVVTLGYGREDCGPVGRGVGSDCYRLRGQDAPHGGSGATVRKTGRTHELACTQDHHAIDPTGYQEREQRVGALVREGDLDHYLEHPEFVDHLGIHHPPLKSLWEEFDYTGHKWGMSIDLSRCTGCNACQVACQSENNIPVVGKKEVGMSREMQWIRIDRYFQGDPEDPQVATQPVACVHCELAPCEGVCPVAATVHTDEGLNAMVYNRCVGTRYCANNCPYKVRRFNFFENNGEMTEGEKMRANPEVTLRARGVMEKCTYCVQRIQSAKITAGNERRPLEDGEITPACAQTCPTEAIVFGDLNDPESRVSKLRAEKRSYDLLAYLNIKPRTSYMARIRNPHPSLAEPDDHGAHHGAGEKGHGDGHGHDDDHGGH
ncbi:4Fe-4S dicluster domain-containing protein [bacterium]|nr:4Fe-4S dicluster domain-containing protein [bacterium]